MRRLLGVSKRHPLRWGRRDRGLQGFLVGFLFAVVSMGVLVFASACGGGVVSSAAFGLPSSPTGLERARRLPPAVPPGPNGWWLVAQRLPQSDFGPGFAYFLVPADTQRAVLPATTQGLGPVPSVCPSPRGVRLVRLALTGGRVAIFCWLKEDGSPNDSSFWVWKPALPNVSPVTLKGGSLSNAHRPPALLLENPLWSPDGKAVFGLGEGGNLLAVRVPQGDAEPQRPLRGIPLAFDPRGRYLAERVYDESRPDPKGTSKQYGISHLYLTDLSTGAEERWRIPQGARQFLPSGEVCRMADYEHAVGWQPRTGESIVFVVECGSGFNAPPKQYVFLANRALARIQLLWRTQKASFVTTLWEPHGQGILLQIALVGANGASQGGETVFLDEQGQVLRQWLGFPTPTMQIVGWGAP